MPSNLRSSETPGCTLEDFPVNQVTNRQSGAVRRWELFLLCGVFAAAILFSQASRVAPFAIGNTDQDVLLETSEPVFGVNFASRDLHRHVHSASITPLPNGGLMAAWFAGSREGARDVNIRGAIFDPQSREWGEEFQLVSRESTEQMLQRDIRKLGNPVLALAPDNRLWLFYVSVSLGGWAGSAINVIHSDDGGESWSAPKRLITSPFFNLSTLVRNPPVFHEDGSIGLPIYHEFIGKFAEYLYLDADGNIIDKFRISDGDDSLQPSVVPLNGDTAVALLRNAGQAHGKVLAAFSHDRGETWSEMVPVDPWNPNSAVAAINEGDNSILVALNDLQDGRFRMSLYHTDEKLNQWRLLRVLDQSPVASDSIELDVFREGITNKLLAMSEADKDLQFQMDEVIEHTERRACNRRGNCEFKYEYPTLIQARDGYFHLVYSWNNTLIKHVFFNRAWLQEHQ